MRLNFWCWAAVVASHGGAALTVWLFYAGSFWAGCGAALTAVALTLFDVHMWEVTARRGQ